MPRITTAAARAGARRQRVAEIDCEFRIVRPNREVRHLRAIATLTRDEDNRPVRMIGINSDITEIRTLAETLHEEKERLQVTLYSIGDAVLTTDAGGRVTFMNPVAEAMTGWTLQDAIGAPHELVFNVLDSDTGEALESPVRRCLQNTRVFYLEDGATLISRKGEQHDIQNCAAPVRTRDGEIIGTVLVFQNVTKARAMQRELSYHASHDALTGLFNRTKFEEELQRALANAQERATPACAVLHRPRPLQGGQRFRRARGGRHDAARAEPDSRRPYPRLRHPGAAGRR
ncbi:PAS domain-containing protein [Pseudomonas aeruginosa]|nr:PAS domain-containing protein [Pseudomonas aeruginosa]